MFPYFLLEGENAVVTAVNSAISSGATEVASVISTNAGVIMPVVIGGVVLAIGIKYLKKLKGAA